MLDSDFKTDFETLERFLNEERQLDSIRKSLMTKIQHSQEKIDQEWKQIDINGKCTLIGEMQNHLYQLQLVEHAAKTPLLNIAKILFTHNPRRCIQREISLAKSKPPKRRKNNELCGLASNSSEETAVKRIASNHETKFNPVNHEDKFDSDEPVTSSNNIITNKKGGRVRRHVRAVKSTPPLSPSRIGNKEGESKDIDEDDPGSMNLILQSPSPALEDDCSLIVLPRRIESTNLSLSGNSSPNARTTRKRGREVVSVVQTTSSFGVRSPRKRVGTEKQLINNESNSSMHEQTKEGNHLRHQIIDEPTYCLCKQISFGDMICCDFELCPVEWFHFSCVNIKSKPKGKKWYCPLCRNNDKINLLKPELQQKLDQMKKAQV